MLNRNEIQLGDVVFDMETRDLRNTKGERIELRNKSSEVLAFLAQHPNEVVQKSRIMEAVWPDVTVSEESLTQCIADIRRTIGDNEQALLQTHIGKGYSLSIGQYSGRKRWQNVALAFVALIACLGIWWMVRPAPTPTDIPRIAVLAFDDLSAGEENGWLSDGIAEGVITELARYREFLVIARNSSFSFRDQATNVTKIADQLDADYIIEGSKQKSGNRLRVTAQLIDGQDGTHIWADEFDGDIGELFDVQSQIVRSIAVQIGSEIAKVPPRIGGREAVNALHFFHKGNAAKRESTPDSYKRALDLYELSIQADPDMPFGYAGMAMLIWADLSQGWVFGDMPRDKLLQKGVDFAEKAISIDPTYYLSHVARGDLHSSAGNQEDAIISYGRAAELNPSSSIALAVAAEPLLYLDRADEAIAMIELAIEVNPVVPGWYYNILARSLWWAGRCDEGVDTIKKRARMRPWDYRALIMNLVCLDKVEEAREAGKKILQIDPTFTVSAHAKRIVGINFPEYQEKWLVNLRAAGLPEA